MKAKSFKKLIIIGLVFSFFYSCFIIFNFDKTKYSKFNIPYNNLVKGDSAYYF